LLYVERSSLWLDLQLILLTMVALFSRAWALRGVAAELARSGAPPDLIRIARREERLAPTPPGHRQYRDIPVKQLPYTALVCCIPQLYT